MSLPLGFIAPCLRTKAYGATNSQARSRFGVSYGVSRKAHWPALAGGRGRKAAVRPSLRQRRSYIPRGGRSQAVYSGAHPYPLVLIHGNAQTPTNWLGTPDGRKGWADFFVEQGYVVYMMEQPMRGRSAWHPSNGATRMFRTDEEERLFTDNARSGNWPQAKKQTQWPGEGSDKGRKGDPVFDAFYATQVEALVSLEETEKANQAAGAALLDKIGPAILITHSQAGYFSWLIADARPMLVKGNIAVEAPGPPIENVLFATGKGRAWGLTNIPITYDPPLTDPSDLAVVKEDKADGPDLSICWMQKSPARQLVNLKDIPTMILVSEASYHTAKWMNQAGVKTDFVRLEDRGIRGNGHMVMIEKNSLEIAKLLDDWIQKNVK